MKFQCQFIYLPEKNQSSNHNMAYKVKGNANYITKRIRHILIARKLKLKLWGLITMTGYGAMTTVVGWVTNWLQVPRNLPGHIVR